MHTIITARRGLHLAPPPADQHLKCLSPSCRTYHAAARPVGARPGDLYVVSEVRDDAPFGGAGDLLICLVTSEVRAGDPVLVRSRGRSLSGFLAYDADGQIVLTDARGEPIDYYFTASEVIGRVVEVQRRGVRIKGGAGWAR